MFQEIFHQGEDGVDRLTCQIGVGRRLAALGALRDRQASSSSAASFVFPFPFFPLPLPLDPAAPDRHLA